MKKLIFFAFLVFFAHDMHAGKTLDPNEGDNYLLFNAQGEQEYDDSALPTILAAHKKGILPQQEKKALETLLGVEQGKPQHDRMVGDFRSNIRKLKKETIVSAYQTRQLNTSAGSHSSTPVSTVATPHATSTSMSTHQEGTPLATTETFVRRRLRSQPRATQDPEIYLLYSSTAQQMYDRSSLGLLKEIANGQAEGKKSIADFRYLEGNKLVLKGENSQVIDTDVLQALIGHVEQAVSAKRFILDKIGTRATERAAGRKAIDADAKLTREAKGSTALADATARKEVAREPVIESYARASTASTPARALADTPESAAEDAAPPRLLTDTSGTGRPGESALHSTDPDVSTAMVPAPVTAGAPTVPLPAKRPMTDEGFHKSGENFLRESLSGEPIQDSHLLFDGSGHQVFKLKSLNALVFLRNNPGNTAVPLGGLNRVELVDAGKIRSAVVTNLDDVLRYAVPKTSSKSAGKTFNDREVIAALQTHVQKIQNLSLRKGIIDQRGIIAPRESEGVGALTVLSTTPGRSSSPSSSNSSDTMVVTNPLAVASASSSPRKASYAYQHGGIPVDGQTRSAKAAEADALRETQYPQRTAEETQDAFTRSLSDPRSPFPSPVSPSPLRGASLSTEKYAETVETLEARYGKSGTTLAGPTHGITTPGSNVRSPSNTSGLTGVFTQASPTPRKQTPATGARADGTQYGPDFAEGGDPELSGRGASTPRTFSRSNSQSSLDSTVQAWPAARDGMSNSLQLEEARSLLAQQRQIAEVTAPLVREAQEARDQATRALSEVTAQQRTLAQTQAALEASIAAQAAAATTPGAPPTDHSAETTTMRTQLAALQGQQGELAAVREELARVRTDAQAAQKQLRRDVLGATERGVAEVKQRIEATQAAAQAATDHAQRIAATLTPITEAQKGIVQELRKQESTQQAHAETLAREALERQALEQRLLTAGRALNAVEEQSTRTQQQLTEHIATAQRDAQKAAADKTALEEQLATLQRQMAALTRPTGEGPAENAELTARMVDLETEQARLKRQVEEAARAQAARDARAEQMARSLADLTHAKATQTREIAELRSRLGSTATREELAAVSQKVAALERESQSSRDTLRRQVAETVATIHTDQRRRAQREFFPEPPGGSPRGPVSPSRSSREGSSLGSFAGSAGGGALISYVAPTPTQLTTPVRREKPIRFATQTHTTSNMWKKRRPAPAPVHTPAPVLTDFKDAFEQAALRLRAPVAHRPEPEVGTADADHTALTKALRPAPSAPSHTVRKASPAQTFWTTATQARTPTQRAHAYRLVPYRPH